MVWSLSLLLFFFFLSLSLSVSLFLSRCQLSSFNHLTSSVFICIIYLFFYHFLSLTSSSSSFTSSSSLPLSLLPRFSDFPPPSSHSFPFFTNIPSFPYLSFPFLTFSMESRDVFTFTLPLAIFQKCSS